MVSQRRYRKYTPGPDPLAPPPNLAKAVRAIADDVMFGYSAEQAMREYLRREGYDDFLRQIAERRQELLQKTNLGGTLKEAKKLLDDALLAERGQLARDVDMDDLDRTMREMTLDNLPTSPAAAVSELGSSTGRLPKRARSTGRSRTSSGASFWTNASPA